MVKRNFNREDLKRAFFLYAIPVVLIAVAFGQNTLVRTHGLTQWKGGGFGMFSTVDSRGTRFLRVFLVTSKGKEVEVSMPERMARTRESVRSHPDPRTIDGLAAQLMATPWIEVYESVAEIDSSQDASSTSERIKPSGLNMEEVDCPTVEQKEYRLLRPTEIVPSHLSTLSPKAIRIEVWSYDFSQENTSLQSRLISERIYNTDVL